MTALHAATFIVAINIGFVLGAWWASRRVADLEFRLRHDEEFWNE